MIDTPGVREYRRIDAHTPVKLVLAKRERVKAAAQPLLYAGCRVAARLHEQLEVFYEAVRELKPRFALVEVRSAQSPTEAQQPPLCAGRRQVECLVVHDTALTERVEFIAGVDSFHSPHYRHGHRDDTVADGSLEPEVMLHAQVVHLEQVVVREQLEVV